MIVFMKITGGCTLVLQTEWRITRGWGTEFQTVGTSRKVPYVFVVVKIKVPVFKKTHDLRVSKQTMVPARFFVPAVLGR